jgi:hypothetical protein
VGLERAAAWAGGDEAVRATLVDGGGGYWWSSSSEVNSRGGGGGRGSPSRWWLGAGVFGVAGQQWRLALLQWLGLVLEEGH